MSLQRQQQFHEVGVQYVERVREQAIHIVEESSGKKFTEITAADIENRPVGSGVGDFVEKYVFPRGELPHLHLAVREMSAAGFEVFDVESLRPHYALTLAHWSRRLEQRLQEAARQVSDRTLRVWRLYLAGCSHGFAQGWMNLHQVLGSRQVAPGSTELPLTRAWLYR